MSLGLANPGPKHDSPPTLKRGCRVSSVLWLVQRMLQRVWSGISFIQEVEQWSQAQVLLILELGLIPSQTQLWLGVFRLLHEAAGTVDVTVDVPEVQHRGLR